MTDLFRVSKIIGVTDWANLIALLDSTTEAHIESAVMIADDTWLVLVATGLRDEAITVRAFRRR